MHYRKTEVSVFFKLLVDCIFIQFQECKKDYQHTGPGFLSKSRQGFFISHFLSNSRGMITVKLNRLEEMFGAPN